MFNPLLLLGAQNFLKANMFKIIGIVGVVLIAAFAYYQYKNNIRLQAENYNLQATVYEAQAQRDRVIEQANRLASINGDLVKKERALNQALFDLSQKFTKNGRDFEELARRKPGLIEPIVNNATREVLQCIELITMDEDCPQ